MIRSLHRRRALTIYAVALTAVSLGGCAGGVELEGRIFDQLGISSNALNASNTEPDMQERAPLVLPPSAELRDPEAVATARSTSTANPLWPQDAEQTAAANQARREAEIKKMCADREWQERVNADEFNRVTDNGRGCSIVGGILDGLL